MGKDEAGPRVWVMSAAEQGSFTFWDPASGARYHHAPGSPAASPYLSIGCAFNHESFYANLQAHLPLLPPPPPPVNGVSSQLRAVSRRTTPSPPPPSPSGSRCSGERSTLRCCGASRRYRRRG